MNEAKPSVSDHALVRLLERKYNLDLEALRAEILTPENIAAIKLGAKSIVSQGVKYVIRGATVVTVLRDDMRIEDKGMSLASKKPTEFQPVGTLVCRHCQGQNLSWSLGCWQCGKALDEDEDVSVDLVAVEEA